MILRKPIFLLLTIFAFEQSSIGQVNADAKEKEGFMSLKDGVMKREIASFNISSELLNPIDSSKKKSINEIPLLNCTDSSSTFSKGDIKVKIVAAKFEAARHKLFYDSSQQLPFLKLIDNKRFWGTDGGVPGEVIKSVTFTNGKFQMTLPLKALDRLYEPNFCTRSTPNSEILYVHSKVFQSLDKKRVYIYMMNSDGAGGYEVTWVIQDNKYLTRIVDYGF